MPIVNEYALTVTVQELDLVMIALSTRPYGEVAGLIAKLLNQANATLVAAQPKAPVSAVPADSQAETLALQASPPAQPVTQT